MTKQRYNWIVLVIAFFCFVTSIPMTQAADITAVSCEQADVQAAIDSASSGDTILVPAGSCTWDASVTMPSGKKITIQGAGKNSTTITTDTVTAIAMNESGARITGIGFVMNGAGTGQIEAKGTGWRIDHCKFTNNYGSSRVTIWVNSTNVPTYPAGLIDNNEFIEGRIIIFRSSNTEEARELWATENPFGTSKNVYIEDNIFYKTVSGGGNVIDAENYCGSYVARYNTVTGDTSFMVHPFAVANTRGPTGWEIYRNTFTASSSPFSPLFIRAGTGFIFDNTISGYSVNGVAFDNWRSFLAVEGTGPTGKCDGSSLWDGNTEANGWPCRDQIGRGPDLWLWTAENPYPPQASMPAYLWLNRNGTSIAPIFAHNNSGSWIQADRDYFNEVSGFDGSKGVGSGTLSNRPVGCTPGVAYWATDQGSWNKTPGGEQGTLYKCVYENTWEKYYEPYAYPHPLRLEDAPTPTLPGDLNSDGTVNIFDYNIFLQNFGNTTCGNIADLNSDCNVNIFDYNILLENFGRTQ